jgi:hypothetical protein
METPRLNDAGRRARCAAVAARIAGAIATKRAENAAPLRDDACAVVSRGHAAARCARPVSFDNPRRTREPPGGRRRPAHRASCCVPRTERFGQESRGLSGAVERVGKAGGLRSDGAGRIRHGARFTQPALRLSVRRCLQSKHHDAASIGQPRLQTTARSLRCNRRAIHRTGCGWARARVHAPEGCHPSQAIEGHQAGKDARRIDTEDST